MSNSIKILTYNVHGGKSPFFKRNIVEKLEQIIINSNADILCIQELWQDVKTKEEQLRKALSQVWPFFHFGENAYFPSYNLGNAIFSRFDILAHKNFPLTSMPYEPRGLLQTKIQFGKKFLIYVYCTHLSLYSKARESEIRECIEIIKSESPDKFILAGDFNDWEESLTPILERELGCHEVGKIKTRKHFKTFPTIFPIFSLDRIYYKGLHLHDTKLCIQKLGPSDHRSIWANFNF